MTAKLFTPVDLGGITLSNRIVVSPMCQYSAVDGSAQPWHQVHYGMLSMSGAGLLCLEATHVEREGRITQGCLGLYSDENEAAIKPIVDWVRGWMPHVKLGIQLAHAGRKASAQRPWKGGGPLTQADAPDLPWTTVSASAIPFDTKWHTPVALDAVGLKRVKQAFVEATLRSLRLGFDLVELHGAHGYCLSQFLSPLSNRRSDEYGGTAQKRRRFPLEVFEACRAVWPRDKALGMRLSAVEWVEGGVTLEDTIETARQLKALGCDFVDVSSGGNSPAQKIQVAPGYHVGFSAASARKPPSRHGRLASLPSPSRPSASSRRARPTAPRMPVPSCSTRAGAGTRHGRLASKHRRCRCRPCGPRPSCRSSRSPRWRGRQSKRILGA